MMRVVDASCVVAALVDDGSDGEWALNVLGASPVAAPHLMPVEVANVLRKAVIAGELSADVAALAHRDLGRLRIEYVSYEPFADRVWELRNNLSAYDAWYVSVAEAFHAPLATLDARLANAAGPLCAFDIPVA